MLSNRVSNTFQLNVKTDDEILNLKKLNVKST